MPALAAGLALLVATSQPRPAPLSRAASTTDVRFGLSLEQRQAVFSELVANDRRWRDTASKRFPDDVWDRADHWTHLMSQHVRKMAAHRGVSPTAILLSYDEGLHAGWRGPGGRTLPATFPPLPLHK